MRSTNFQIFGNTGHPHILGTSVRPDYGSGGDVTGAEAPRHTGRRFFFGKASIDRKAETQAQICGSRLYPLQRLRAFAGRHSTLRHLPYLFP